MAGFSASTYVLLKGYVDGQVKDVIGTMAQGMTFKGHVPTQADLPSTHNNGDLWIVDDMNTAAAGNQGAKAVWVASEAKWVFFDEIPSKVSQLENDEFFLSQKVNGTSYVDNIHIDGTVKTHTATATNPHEYIISDIQFNRGDSASLATYVPKAGEPVFEYDGTNYKLKIGNGVKPYVALPYIGGQYELSADEKSVHLQGSQIQIFGFTSAANGLIPRKKGGVLQWVKANDVFKFVAGKAIDIAETVASDNTVAEKFDVKYDNTTVKVNANNQLEVPIDNDTISISGGKLTARKPVAGDVSIKVEEVAGETKITGNYKAGTNVTLESKPDGIYINAQGGGGAGDIEAGKAIKFTQNTTTGATIINADYDAGDYIDIKTVGGRTSINVKPEAVQNTVRPIKANGAEILGSDPISGPINFGTTNDIKATVVASSSGKTINYEIANRAMIQAEKQPDNSIILKDLNNNYIVYDCGGANFSM